MTTALFPQIGLLSEKKWLNRVKILDQYSLDGIAGGTREGVKDICSGGSNQIAGVVVTSASSDIRIIKRG